MRYASAAAHAVAATHRLRDRPGGACRRTVGLTPAERGAFDRSRGEQRHDNDRSTGVADQRAGAPSMKRLTHAITGLMQTATLQAASHVIAGQPAIW